MRSLTYKDHQRLESFCKTVCTGKIGWNRSKRKVCREKTMCMECQRRVNNA